MNLEMTTDVPEIDPNYVPFGFYKDLKTIIKSKIFYPILIVGESGSGKTVMIQQVVASLGREVIRVNISPETDFSDLIGGPTLENGNIVFREGPVLQAFLNGKILLLDELDRGTSKLLALMAILEGNSFYNGHTKEHLHPKDGFNIIATANTKGYSENPKYLTQVLDSALLERFSITVEQEYPTAIVETKILSKVLDDVDFVATLIKWANVIRDAHNQGAVDDIISTRRLLHIAKTYSIFKNKKKAIELCVSRFEEDTKLAFLDLYNKIDSGDDLEEDDSGVKIWVDELDN